MSEVVLCSHKWGKYVGHQSDFLAFTLLCLDGYCHLEGLCCFLVYISPSDVYFINQYCRL